MLLCRLAVLAIIDWDMKKNEKNEEN